MKRLSWKSACLLLMVSLAFAVQPDKKALAADKKPKRNLEVGAVAASVANEQRVALVIGNSDYKEAPLKNPPNDAEDIAAVLRGLGFDVISRKNANQQQFKAAVREFGQKLRGAESGLFYFAGHGMQVKGVNYLVPAAVDIQGEADAEDQSVSLDYVMRTMEESGAKINIAILDACRNNPFAHSFRSVSRGLAQTQAASGMLIAYATSPGSVAADGTGRNGIYTKHLIKNLKEGDSDVLKVFQRVRAGVVTETAGKQTPWETTSLVGDFYFRPSTLVATVSPQPMRLQSVEEIEQELWNALKESRQITDFEDYLKQYPNGKFAALAKQKIKVLAAQISPLTQVTLPVPPVGPQGRRSQNSNMLAVGDMWRYIVKTRGENKSKEVIFEVAKVGEKNISEVFRLHVNGVQKFAEDREVKQVVGMYASNIGQDIYMDFSPYLTTFEDLGKQAKWSRGSIANFAPIGTDYGTYDWLISAKKIGQEKVIVPAGEFDAIKIEFSGSRPTGPSNCNFCTVAAFSDTFWFAPEVKRYVKRIHKTKGGLDLPGGDEVYELAEYSLH